MRRDKPLPEAVRRTPTIPANAAMVRTGVGAAGALLLQLVPAHPDGNVGGPGERWPSDRLRHRCRSGVPAA